MNDILPPKRPMTQRVSEPRPAPRPIPASPPPSAVALEEITTAEPDTPPPISPRPKKSKSKLFFLAALITFLLVLIAAVGTWLWYNQQLNAVTPGSDEMVKVTIPAGIDPQGIGELLHEKELIRNTTAFSWYVRLQGVSGNLQSGVYRLSKGANVANIVEHITSGKTDSFSITFLPGDTLAKHRKALVQAGYKASVVDEALSKTYNHPLLQGKPANADLEGYIYGETYQFPADSTVEQILLRTFDEFYTVIKANDLVATYKKQGLSLYEAITLASIVQREEKQTADQKQVAQVFYLRLAKDMPLGSDPTYQYIADKMNIERNPALDSPYNTRKVVGLPPGPIASPGETALIAVAQPAEGDYLYFLNGDDEKMYFGRTNEEHEKNIRDHCQQKCTIL